MSHSTHTRSTGPILWRNTVPFSRVSHLPRLRRITFLLEAIDATSSRVATRPRDHETTWFHPRPIIHMSVFIYYSHFLISFSVESYVLALPGSQRSRCVSVTTPRSTRAIRRRSQEQTSRRSPVRSSIKVRA